VTDGRSRTPRLLGELDAVFRPEQLLEASEVVARLAARHPDAGMAGVMGRLYGVLVAEVGVRLDEPEALQRRESRLATLLASLMDLPDGHGPRLLEWRTDHLVARLLRAAWRDHSHLAWRDYQDALG
jgi:hypothetical protein